jgi:MFS transporter, FSR family, fosmidomycin resistance protein
MRSTINCADSFAKITLEEQIPMGRRAELVLISLGHASIHWYNQIFFVLLPVLVIEFDVSYTQAGFLATAKTLGSALLNAPGSALIDFFGKRRLAMGLALVWAGFCYLAISLAPSYWLVAVCFTIIALAGVLWHAPAMATLSERFEDRRGMALSAHEVGANIGDTLAPVAVGTLLASMYWRDVVQLNTAVGVILGFGLLFLLRESGRAQSQPRPVAGGSGKRRMEWSEYVEGIKGLLRNTVLLRLAMISSFRSMGQIGLMTSLPLYITFGLGIDDPGIMGLYLTLLTGASLIGGPVLGTVSDHIGRKPIMVGGLVIAGGTALLLTVAPPGFAFIGVLVLLGTVLFSIRPVIMANALDVTPNHLGASVIGLMFTIQAAFSSASPVVVGWVGDTFHVGAGFYVVGGLILVSGLIALTIPRSTDTPSPGEAPAN